MEPINARDRPISVTASQRLNGVSPNPNPRSVEVGDILLWGTGVSGRFGTWYLRIFPVV
jgi:hypothetical protein